MPSTRTTSPPCWRRSTQKLALCIWSIPTIPRAQSTTTPPSRISSPGLRSMPSPSSMRRTSSTRATSAPAPRPISPALVQMLRCFAPSTRSRALLVSLSAMCSRRDGLLRHYGNREPAMPNRSAASTLPLLARHLRTLPRSPQPAMPLPASARSGTPSLTI